LSDEEVEVEIGIGFGSGGHSGESEDGDGGREGDSFEGREHVDGRYCVTGSDEAAMGRVDARGGILVLDEQ
jgi:hypothetical protein